MCMRCLSQVPVAFMRFSSVLLIAGVLGGCGRHEASNAAEKSATISASQSPDAVEQPPPAPHRFRIRLTHRSARHRHAGPR